ncbi:MAG: hypothetical protein N4A71_17690 [Carboxylicivirga sp.]|jgi:hypothetical protein|nr:hypothetical protein [Carboxylicivirga sp.]
MTTKLMTLTLLLMMLIGLKAQETKTISPAQVTFAYPLGTNGQQSKNITNRFSFNVLYGINGGVKSFELGGIGNQNQGDVQGFQLAGISNITDGSSSGAVISGITNITTGSVDGMQLTGIANVNNGTAKGAQIAGIANISGDVTNGLMLSGIANVSAANVTGMQLSLINTTHGDMNGFQLGLVNYAKKIKGFQLGLINVADSIDGVALGLISYTRDGYFAIEASNSEVMHANLSYKMGTSYLYNIYNLGYGRYNNKDVYSYGLGLGTLVPLHQRHSLAIEGITNHIAYDNEWDEVNLLTKLNLTYQFRLTKCISLIGGPSLNLYISDVMVDGKYGTLDMPKTFWDHKGNKNMHYAWLGYNIGINIQF